jgi:hypothetical protein
MPVFLTPELEEEIFDTVEPSCMAVKYMREGLNDLGLFDVSKIQFSSRCSVLSRAASVLRV